MMPCEKQPCTYIVTNKKQGTLYIGVTSNLAQRIAQHRNGMADGFSKKFNLKMLVYLEQHETMEQAITREKALKEWQRAWKIRLIEEQNPHWCDLYAQIAQD